VGVGPYGPTGQLGSYLAGLVEADGSIVVSSKTKSEKGSSIHPTVKIVFHSDDLPLAAKLVETLGHGIIDTPKDTLYCLLYFRSVAGLLKVAHLINGKMRTPKIEALYRLIDWLNWKLPSETLPKLPLDKSPISANAWLSGFR